VESSLSIENAKGIILDAMAAILMTILIQATTPKWLAKKLDLLVEDYSIHLSLS
jgi:hypothetical protein